MNDNQLDEYCNTIAEDICRDARDWDQALDWAHESADSSEYAIYIHKAHELCQSCDISQGEEFAQDCFGDKFKTYDELACLIAYGEIRARVEARVWAIFEEREAEEVA